MSVEQNKVIARRVIEEGISPGRVTIADELIAPEFIDHSGPPGFPATGPESFKQLVTAFRSAFPDLAVTIEHLVAEGDKVVVAGTMRGTHQGSLFGIPPTGRAFTMTATDILRIVEGKVVEHWGNEDDLGMMQQLGVIPELVQAG
jgi:predicted ester cyclase